MKRVQRIVSTVLCCVMAVMLVLGNGVFNSTEEVYAASKVWNGKADTEWFEGDLDYYEISTAEQLAGLAKLVNEGYSMSGVTIALTDDIYLNKTSNFAKWDKKAPKNQWTMIGSKEHTFRGIFDGQGHAIYGMYIKDDVRHSNGWSSWTADGGLFGYTVGASIANLKIKNAYLNTLGANGAVAARAQESFFYGIEVTSSVFKNGTAGGVVGKSTYDYTSFAMNWVSYIAMAGMGAWFNPFLFGDSLMLPKDFKGALFYGCKVKSVKFIDNVRAAGVCAEGGNSDTGIGVKSCLVMNISMKTDGTKGAVMGAKPSDYAVHMDCYKNNIKVNKKSKNKTLIDKSKVKTLSLDTLKNSGASKLGDAFENVAGKEPRLKLFTRNNSRKADETVYKTVEDGYYYIVQRVNQTFYHRETYVNIDENGNVYGSGEPQKLLVQYRDAGFYTISTPDGKILTGSSGSTISGKDDAYNAHRLTQKWFISKNKNGEYNINYNNTERYLAYFQGFLWQPAKMYLANSNNVGVDGEIVWQFDKAE